MLLSAAVVSGMMAIMQALSVSVCLVSTVSVMMP